MNYTWFKLHHELPDDPKLRRFNAQEKWAWVVLLCLGSKSSVRGVINLDDEDIAACCEFNTTQDWLYYRDKLIGKGMLEIDGNGNLVIINWEDRQYEKPSDKPEAVKARVARHRAKKKVEKDHPVTPCNALQGQSNADVTPQIREDKIREDQIREEKIRSDQEKKEEKEFHAIDSRVSSSEACDRAFMKFRWGFASTPDPDFVKYIKDVYLPGTPSYQEKTVSVHQAKLWLSSAKYDSKRLDAAEIVYDAFVEWRDGSTRSPSSASADLRKVWAQQAEQQGHEFYLNADGRIDQEKYEFYREYINAAQPA